MHTDSDVETGPLFVIEALADLYHPARKLRPFLVQEGTPREGCGGSFRGQG